MKSTNLFIPMVSILALVSTALPLGDRSVALRDLHARQNILPEFITEAKELQQQLLRLQKLLGSLLDGSTYASHAGSPQAEEEAYKKAAEAYAIQYEIYKVLRELRGLYEISREPLYNDSSASAAASSGSSSSSSSTSSSTSSSSSSSAASSSASSYASSFTSALTSGSVLSSIVGSTISSLNLSFKRGIQATKRQLNYSYPLFLFQTIGKCVCLNL
ncbi:hypothetical protein PTMSG1_04625 [Pyrenophora teres f. maculata]|nr:hypothetical protein PTMSG1_04625 [Pyrenophora teres f. maculata]